MSIKENPMVYIINIEQAKVKEDQGQEIITIHHIKENGGIILLETEEVVEL